MPLISEISHAPELEGGRWIQGGPVALKKLRGKAIVLIDFWDYTCVNCLRTLPYVMEWDRRYRESGLVVVGVHAPEFSFAREASYVEEAVRRLRLEYPIVLDNDYAIWRAYSNRHWPAKYLIDSNGSIRYYHFGEGRYGESETQIQALLHELNPALAFFPPMAPVRDTDQPGAVCYRVTPELYLGYARGTFGNPDSVLNDQVREYHDPGRHIEGQVYLEGRWRVEQECARADAEGATLRLYYTGKEVNLVIAPRPGAAVKAELILKRGDVPGVDVKSANGHAIITVDQPRMYNLVANDSVQQGALELKALEAGIAVYAFTFTSCTLA